MTEAARLKVKVMMVAKIKGTVSDSVSKVVGRGNDGSLIYGAVSVTAAARLKVEGMMVAKVKGTVSVTAAARLKVEEMLVAKVKGTVSVTV